MKYLFVLVLSFCISLSSFAKTNERNEDVDVLHYEIYLNEINFTDKTIEAVTTIDLKTLSEISLVEFELKSLTVSSVTSDVAEIESFSQEDDVLKINLSSPLPANSNVSFTVNYGGNTFNENWGGIHWSGNYVYNLGVGFDSQPHNLGKTWFPCVDNFDDKASYELFVTIDSNMTSSCSGFRRATIHNDDGSKTENWVVNQDISTYLMSFAIGEFILWEDTYQGMEKDIPIQVYAKPNQIDKVEATFANTKAIAAFYEDKFGPYPFNRIGYVSTNLGCMEHVDNIALASSLITGTTNLDSEYFIAHEMAHAWFGNLTTCSTAGDMWLNEGFATFCNYYYLSELYGEEMYRASMSELIDDIIHSCHNSEGWIPLNDMPLDLTYGTTVYDKGAIVVHTMMNYLGRETFDAAIKHYLNKFSYSTASSDDLRDAIEEATGIDMSDFFNTWVYTPGSPAYNVQYFTVEPKNDKYEVSINMNHKHRGSEHIGKSIIYELTFIDENWNMVSDTVRWDGESGISNKTLDFAPVAIFCDYENKFADACESKTFIIKENKSFDFGDAKFKAIATDVADSTLLRIEHYWVGPKSFGEIPEGLTISSDRYWKINRLDKGESVIKGEFQYQKNNVYDDNLIVSENDSIVLLYRTDGSQMWQSINYDYQGFWNFGKMTVNNLQSGDYVLGMWEEEHASLNEIDGNNTINIYPNPAKENINICFDKEIKGKIVITNALGQTLNKINISDRIMNINISDLDSGIYNIVITDKNKNLIKTQKLVIE